MVSICVSIYETFHLMPVKEKNKKSVEAMAMKYIQNNNLDIESLPEVKRSISSGAYNLCKRSLAKRVDAISPNGRHIYLYWREGESNEIAFSQIHEQRQYHHTTSILFIDLLKRSETPVPIEFIASQLKPKIPKYANLSFKVVVAKFRSLGYYLYKKGLVQRTKNPEKLKNEYLYFYKETHQKITTPEIQLLTKNIQNEHFQELSKLSIEEPNAWLEATNKLLIIPQLNNGESYEDFAIRITKFNDNFENAIQHLSEQLAKKDIDQQIKRAESLEKQYTEVLKRLNNASKQEAKWREGVR